MDLLAVTHRFKLIHAGLSPGLMYLISSYATKDASMQIQRNLPELQFPQRRLLVTQTDGHRVFTNSQILIVYYLLSRMNPGYSPQRPMLYMLRCHILSS